MYNLEAIIRKQTFGFIDRLYKSMKPLEKHGLLGNLINHLCYADDLCLIALSSSGMQYLLDICDKYATGHQLTYNATKSFTLCFKPKHIKIGIPDFVLGKLVIPAVDKCKYLGIIISEANCDGDLKRQMRKYYANANMLLRKFSYCSPGVKCCMFKSYCATNSYNVLFVYVV